MPAVSLYALQHTQGCHEVQEEAEGHAHAANAAVSRSPPLAPFCHAQSPQAGLFISCIAAQTHAPHTKRYSMNNTACPQKTLFYGIACCATAPQTQHSYLCLILPCCLSAWRNPQHLQLCRGAQPTTPAHYTQHLHARSFNSPGQHTAFCVSCARVCGISHSSLVCPHHDVITPGQLQRQ